MQQAAVYELCVAPPHEPADARFTPVEFARYREGYTMALVMALRVMDGAEQRYKMYLRTRKLATRRARADAARRATSRQEPPHDDL